jgi:Fe-S-cluster-containing dehydrogenase component/DMSO reductase anchor subunit
VSSVQKYLDIQEDLTAVEHFSQFHDNHQDGSNHGERYQHLIPLTSPGKGEQYAFEVDMDSCTGCKACVTGCHNQNGLGEAETWRSVGTVYGGTTEAPFLQTVTTACHHCANPACMEGCPTQAYQKDPVTGIVKHLDDQCFGCQYCMIKCPYGVPQFDKTRGIVRKCDMCSDRLSVGEAPACVQSCPNEAIKITLVDLEDVKANPEDFVNIPGSPDSIYTNPTTRYTTKKSWNKNARPSDYHVVEAENPHLPLVCMLVLTQLSVGGFWAEFILEKFFMNSLRETMAPIHLLFSLGLGLLALLSSVFHLGRPLYAYRAFIGLRTSWLSREILFFALFAKLAVLYVAVKWFSFDLWIGHEVLSTFLAIIVCLTGLLGVICSIMIYKDTPRTVWAGRITPLKFFGTMSVMGMATIILTSLTPFFFQSDMVNTLAVQAQLRFLPLLLVFFTIFKLLLDVSPLLHLRDKELSYLKRTAILMVKNLVIYTQLRFFLGILGGICFPLLICYLIPEGKGGAALGLAAVSFILLLIGEFLERYLYFRAVVAPKMPG